MKNDRYESVIKNEQIGRRAMRKAQEENHKLGLPNVYVIKGKIVYELPDGTFTSERPEILKRIVL